jgi:hypothetical protein
VVSQLIKEAFDVQLLVPSEYLSASKTRHVFILEVALLFERLDEDCDIIAGA